jgi:hypothetical protein
MAGGFDEEWLARHNAKMAAARRALQHAFTPPPPVPMIIVQPPADRIGFSLPLLLLLPNRMAGKHWSVAHKQKGELQKHVAIASNLWLDRPPMERARVTITRFCCGVEPDPDNLMASCKPLIDLLLVKSDKHPHSFGLIVDDDKARLLPVAASQRVPRKTDERTEVLVECM